MATIYALAIVVSQLLVFITKFANHFRPKVCKTIFQILIAQSLVAYLFGILAFVVCLVPLTFCHSP